MARGAELVELGWQLVVPPISRSANFTIPEECFLFDNRTRRDQATAVALEALFGPAGAGAFYYNDVGAGVTKVIVTLVVILFCVFVCLILRPKDPADASLGVRLLVGVCWVAGLWLLAWAVWDAILIGNRTRMPTPIDDFCLLTA